MAGEQIEASTSTSTCTVATTRSSATVRYRYTVPGEVYEASKDYCTVRARLLYGTRTAGQEAKSMSHIFQKNATKFETRITRHETIRHDSVCDVMCFRKFTDTFD